MRLTRSDIRNFLLNESTHDDRSKRARSLTYDMVQRAMDELGPGVPSSAVAAYLQVDVEDVHRALNYDQDQFIPMSSNEAQHAAEKVMRHFGFDPDRDYKLTKRLSDAIYEILTPPHP